ncbi:hypothetical protein KC361_g171 [Hortaea werneckii]|nr:hypothetical protein KC361_g171 [Hortaea werneckii]
MTHGHFRAEVNVRVDAMVKTLSHLFGSTTLTQRAGTSIPACTTAIATIVIVHRLIVRFERVIWDGRPDRGSAVAIFLAVSSENLASRAKELHGEPSVSVFAELLVALVYVLVACTEARRVQYEQCSVGDGNRRYT